MSDRAVEEFSQWDEMTAASDLSCGSLGSQQVSQASLGPVAGDSLDLSALDASIREDVETLSKSLSATSVHSRTADLDFMEPEATACGSPRAGAVRGSPRALLSRSSSAVSVYSGRADFDIMTSAVSVHSGTADLDIMEPEATACVSPRADDVRGSPRAPRLRFRGLRRQCRLIPAEMTSTWRQCQLIPAGLTSKGRQCRLIPGRLTST